MKKKFLIIDSRPYGLFSIFLHTIDNIKWAEDNGYIPIVRWGPGRRDPNKGRDGSLEATQNGDPKHVIDKNNFLTEEKPPCFNNTKGMKHCQCLYWSKDGWNGATNPWEYYFEPLNTYSLADVTKLDYDVSDIFMCGELDFELENKFLIKSVHLYEPLLLWELIDTEYEKAHRIEVNKVIKRHVCIKDNISSKIDNFYNSNFIKNGKTMAVHVRGTDKKLEYPHKALALSSYLESIENVLQADSDIKNLYIASDNNEAIAVIIKNFRQAIEKIIVYPAVRMPKYYAKDPICLTSATGPKHGEEVLIESYIMSRASHLICTDSNVAAAAAYINPDLKIHFLNRKYGR
mgnify:CR=1 FL=1|tara:strand:+ start:5871 stop:6908 length:1038 start_codon:yes stop_codon:yes gene_type:complete